MHIHCVQTFLVRVPDAVRIVRESCRPIFKNLLLASVVRIGCSLSVDVRQHLALSLEVQLVESFGDSTECVDVLEGVR